MKGDPIVGLEVVSRVIRAEELLEDGDASSAWDVLKDLELDLAGYLALLNEWQAA